MTYYQWGSPENNERMGRSFELNPIYMVANCAKCGITRSATVGLMQISVRKNADTLLCFPVNNPDFLRDAGEYIKHFWPSPSLDCLTAFVQFETSVSNIVPILEHSTEVPNRAFVFEEFLSINHWEMTINELMYWRKTNEGISKMPDYLPKPQPMKTSGFTGDFNAKKFCRKTS